jgi:hypothetical protein
MTRATWLPGHSTVRACLELKPLTVCDVTAPGVDDGAERVACTRGAATMMICTAGTDQFRASMPALQLR